MAEGDFLKSILLDVHKDGQRIDIARIEAVQKELLSARITETDLTSNTVKVLQRQLSAVSSIGVVSDKTIVIARNLMILYDPREKDDIREMETLGWFLIGLAKMNDRNSGQDTH